MLVNGARHRALTAMRTRLCPSISHSIHTRDTVDGIIRSMALAFPSAQRYLSQLSKFKHGATSLVNWPRADARITHSPSHSGGLLKKKRKHAPASKATEKESPFGSHPVGSGLGEGGRAARSKKKGRLRRGTTTVDMSKVFQTFLFPPSLPCPRCRIVMSHILRVTLGNSLVWWSDAIPISHFPSPQDRVSA
jgi:hypothetical protein